MMKTSSEDKFDYLRSFAADPASSVNDTTVIRAEARLEQILASPPLAEPITNRQRKHKFAPKRLRAIRWAAIPLTAAAVIAAGIIWPGNPVTPGPALTAHAALATWQPVPQPLPADLLTIADAACRDEVSAAAEAMVEGWRTTDLPAGAVRAQGNTTIGELVIAEQRGDWGFLAYAAEGAAPALFAAGDQQFHNTSTCIVWFPARAPGNVVLMTSSFSTFGLVNDVWIGGSTFGSGWRQRPADHPIFIRPQVQEQWSGTDSLQDDAGNVLIGPSGIGARFAGGGEEESALFGILGNLDGATAATIQVGNTIVTPTISGDWYAAWWPVTRDMDLLAQQIQCRADWHELSNLDQDLADQAWCTGNEFTPQISAITFTYPDGETNTYRDTGASERSRLQVIANLETARAAQLWEEESE